MSWVLSGRDGKLDAVSTAFLEVEDELGRQEVWKSVGFLVDLTYWMGNKF